MARRKLEIVLAGDETGALRAMGATEKAAGGMGKAALAAGAVVAAAAAGAAVGLFKIGSAFDEQYDKIRVGTGATGDALKGLQGDFKAVLTNVPASFADAGTAVADLNTRLGLTGPALQERSAQFLELSRITKTDVAGNIANLTRVFGDWDIAAEDQAATLDKVYRAAQGSGAGLEQLSTQVVQFGAPLRQLGFSLDESLAILGKFEKEGVNTELVLGSMRQALGRMARAGEEPIETFKRVTGEIKSAGSAGEANALALEMFGARAGPDMAAAIREGRFELGDLLTTISGGSDTIMQAGKDTQDFGEKWQLFINRTMVKLEPIAMRVFDALTGLFDLVFNRDFTSAFASAFNVSEDAPIVNTLFRIRDAVAGAIPVVLGFVRNVLGELAAWWQRNGPAIISFALSLAAGVKLAFDGIVSGVQFVIRNWDRFKLVAAGVVAFLLPGFAVLGAQAMVSATKQAAAWLMTQTATLRSAAVHSAHIAVMVAKFAFLGVQALLHAGKVAAAWLIAMGPIGLVIAAVGGLVALVVVHWDTIKRVTLNLWNSVKAWTATAWEFVKGVFTAGLNFVRAIWTTYWNAISAFYLGIWNGIRAIVTGAWNFVRGFLATGLQTLSGIWRGAWDGIRSFLAGVWSGMRSTVFDSIGSVIRFFSEMPGRILRALGNIGGLLVDKGKELIEGFARGVRNVAGNVAAAVKDAIVGAVRKIPLIGGRAASWLEGALGDGPGLNANHGGPGATAPGGNVLRRVQSVLGGFAGARVTSTYRSPAANRAAGGSPTSYHMDRNNPAVDIGGPTSVLDRLAAKLRSMGGWREFLWRVKGHFDHIHVAHSGGIVSPSWPTLAGLRADERPAVLQVGERVIPKGHDGTSSSEIHLHFHGPVDQDGVRWVVSKINEAKRKGYVGVS